MESRSSVQKLPPYVPGMQVPGKIKMASNENPLGMGKRALEAIALRAQDCHFYPEGSGKKLREALAARYGLDASEVILGNGSDEVIFFAAAAFLNAGEEVLIADHTFSEYRFSGTIMDGQIKPVALRQGSFALDDFLAAITEKTRLIFLCSPNNPTGTIIPQKDVEAFLAKVRPDILVIMDQAYAEFADDPAYGDCTGLIRTWPNLMVTRTFSKLYGMAGLRMGYGLACADLVAHMGKVKPPFNTSILAQEAALASLGDLEYIAQSLKLNKEGRDWIQAELGRLGLPFFPSQANFVCLDTQRDAKAVFDFVFERGIILRPCGSFGLPSCLRISVGTMEQNRRCMDLLEIAIKRIPEGGVETYLKA